MFQFGRKSLQFDDRLNVSNKSSSSFSFTSLISPRQAQCKRFYENIQTANHNSDKKQTPKDEIKQRFGKKQLPADFAEKLLHLEIELELNENVQIDVITDLIHLYTIGVEYYESIKDRKQVYFQKKLNQIYTKPQFLLTTTPSKQIDQKKDNQTIKISIQKKEFEDQQKKLQLDLIYDEQNSQQAQVQELVQTHSTKAKKIGDFIQNDITQQDDSFKKRLENRRKAGMTKSCSQPFLVPVNPEITEFDHNQNLSISPVQTQNNDVMIIKEEEEDDIQNRKISGYFKRAKQTNYTQEKDEITNQQNKSLVSKQI